MLRRAGLARRTALKARTGLKTGAGLTQGGALARTPLKPVSDRQKVIAGLDAAWSRRVRERDRRCVLRGQVPEVRCWGGLAAHHIWPKEDYPARRHDESNGVTACAAHHDWVHNRDPLRARRLGFLRP